MKNGGKMTAKRFRYILFDGFEDYGEYISPNEVVNLLNTLYEENRELQRHLDVMRSGALTDDKRIKELYDENEQLKKEIENGIESFKKIQRCHTLTLVEENEQLKKRIKELELLNDGLNYALQNIRKIDVEIDVGDKE